MAKKDVDKWSYDYCQIIDDYEIEGELCELPVH